jgi:hypothetical protein
MKRDLRKHTEGRKQPKDECWVNVNGVDLLVGFVPLCGPQSPSFAPKCPDCGLVMVDDGDGYCCLDCGVLT